MESILRWKSLQRPLNVKRDNSRKVYARKKGGMQNEHRMDEEERGKRRGGEEERETGRERVRRNQQACSS